MNADDTVDKVASHFWPRDGPRDYFPVSTYGNGNCLPRSLAHIFLGDENRHKEVHVRITFVAVLKANEFLNNLIYPEVPQKVLKTEQQAMPIILEC